MKYQFVEQVNRNNHIYSVKSYYYCANSFHFVIDTIIPITKNIVAITAAITITHSPVLNFAFLFIYSFVL